jgi:hypothetical protein
MTIIAKDASEQERDTKIAPGKRYRKPTLRIYGSCDKLTATLHRDYGARDHSGGRNAKTR